MTPNTRRLVIRGDVGAHEQTVRKWSEMKMEGLIHHTEDRDGWTGRGETPPVCEASVFPVRAHLTGPHTELSIHFLSWDNYTNQRVNEVHLSECGLFVATEGFTLSCIRRRGTGQSAAAYRESAAASRAGRPRSHCR